MLAGGGILAYDGLRRGGWAGVGETTAGGALIGAKFGGPLGAVIGGAAGFVAGIVRLGIKSAAEKVIEKVRTIYGLTIDRKFAQQIVDIANQRYAKNLDMAVRSPEARDLLRLYAQTTGQRSMALLADQARPAALIEARGQLLQGPVFENGMAYAYPSSLRNYQNMSASLLPTAGPNAGGPMVNNIILDAAATVNLVSQGALKTLTAYPRAVASSALNGSRQSSARGGFAVNTLAPGVITQ